MKRPKARRGGSELCRKRPKAEEEGVNFAGDDLV